MQGNAAGMGGRKLGGVAEGTGHMLEKARGRKIINHIATDKRTHTHTHTQLTRDEQA